jgi:hypothetical protein
MRYNALQKMEVVIARRPAEGRADKAILLLIRDCFGLTSFGLAMTEFCNGFKFTLLVIIFIFACSTASADTSTTRDNLQPRDSTQLSQYAPTWILPAQHNLNEQQNMAQDAQMRNEMERPIKNNNNNNQEVQQSLDFQKKRSSNEGTASNEVKIVKNILNIY